MKKRDGKIIWGNVTAAIDIERVHTTVFGQLECQNVVGIETF